MPPRVAARPLAWGLAAVLALAPAPLTALGSPVAPPRSSAAPVVTAHSYPQQGWPRRTVLTAAEPDRTDAALRPGLTAYHQIAPLLNNLQRASDRVSAQVIGTTALGRELYLVTLTAPESAREVQRQEHLRSRILNQPQQAALDPSIARDYKVPVMVTANVHGDEREGTDAALRLVQDYATSTDSRIEQVLKHTRISLVVSANPDGRVANTRANSAGFDLNRDFITATQPETRAVREAVVRTQPMMLLDLHGYVNGTLIEPTTPPHAENIEADLMLKHAYPNALGIEQAILALGYDGADGVRPPQLPFRDWSEGWDGWPPIFTPQYATLHGAVASTIELPLRTNRSSYDLPVAELRRRASVNTAVADTAIRATLRYAVQHRTDLVADQIEWFRRGVTGSAQVPVTSREIPGAGAEDVWLTDYPRGYVIPVGDRQRSAPAAARLVEHLIANGVEVTRAARPLTVGGRSYPPGSYLVDLRQARRGVAGAILGPGTDVSRRAEAMYDISGWSLAQLWGADVITVPEWTDLPPAGAPIRSAGASGELRGEGPWLLPLTDPADVAALHDLLGAGVDLTWTVAGAVIPDSAGRVAEQVTRQHGVELAPADASRGTPLVDPVQVAVAAGAQEQWALGEMGFEIVPISSATLNKGFDWSTIDTLYVSSRLHWRDLDQTAQEGLTKFLADGGGLVARGPAGTALNEALDVLEVTPQTGRADANGVINVDNAATDIAYGASPQTFVYSPMWFTDLAEEVVVDQRYAGDDTLVSGHWRAGSDGSGGQDAAAGQALVVHGVDGSGQTKGAPVVIFGSEPLFRGHPKGQYPLIARALIWSSLRR